MAYLTVHKWDEFESNVVNCMFLQLPVVYGHARSCGDERLQYLDFRRRMVYNRRVNIEREEARTQKKCQCRRNWTIFSPWYNNINRLTTIIEKERGREREGREER